MTLPETEPHPPCLPKGKSGVIKCLIVLIVLDLILSSRVVNIAPSLTFWLVLTACVSLPFAIRLLLKPKWSKSATTSMGLSLFLVLLISMLIHPTPKETSVVANVSPTMETEGATSKVETNPSIEGTKPYIKLKDIEIIDMGGGVAEVDFKADSSFSPEDELDVAIRKETLTKNGFRRCTFYTRSTYRQLDPIKYGHLKPYTVEELTTGTGATFSEKDPERRICDDFHYAPEKPRKLYPILSVNVSREENGETIEDIVDIPWRKAHKFY